MAEELCSDKCLDPQDNNQPSQPGGRT